MSTKTLTLGFPDALPALPDYPVYGIAATTRDATSDMLVWPDGGLRWSSDAAVPPVGAEVIVAMNKVGPATVQGYFVEYGFLGLVVLPQSPPEWYVRQNGLTPCHVYGAELEHR